MTDLLWITSLSVYPFDGLRDILSLCDWRPWRTYFISHILRCCHTYGVHWCDSDKNTISCSMYITWTFNIFIIKCTLCSYFMFAMKYRKIGFYQSPVALKTIWIHICIRTPGSICLKDFTNGIDLSWIPELAYFLWNKYPLRQNSCMH